MKESSSYAGIPEPLPDWTEGKAGQTVWKWALPVHSYTFGAIFFAIAVYAVHILVKLARSQSRKSRNYFICITVLVLVFGLSRATVLLLEPYSTRRPLQLTPGYGLLLFSLGYPCLTSGFFLINWSLVEVTKLQLLPSVIHKRKVLALVLIIHFIVVVTFDTLFVHFPDTHILLFICRSFFVLWGILLFSGFIVAAMRIQRQVKQTLRTISRLEATTAQRPNTDNNNNNNNAIRSVSIVTSRADASQNNRLQQARTRKVMKVARRAAATGLLICCTQIYALWEFFVFYNNDVVPQAWPWWAYQTCFRCIELFMISQMFLITRPRR